MQTDAISIYDYTDYRRYLLDYYRHQKKRTRAFSYRYFARKAQINSVGLYKDIVDGRKGLGRALLRRFSGAMGHTPKEAEYFENMVFFCEAATVEERRIYFERMLSAREPRIAYLEAAQYEYYSKWYYSAIRALLSYYDFDGDYAALGRRLSPTIRPHQARKAIDLLEQLSLISRDENERYRPTDSLVSTGRLNERNVELLNVMRYQQTMMDMARESFDRHPTDRLDMSTLTLSVSNDTLKAMKEEIAALRKKLMQLAEEDPKPEAVYQVNYQVFPLSRTATEDDGA